MKRLVWSGVASLLAACGTAPGAFSDKGYKNTAYDYEVRPVYNNGALLSRDWLIDNYYDSSGELKPKEEGDYETRYRLDRDGDGAVDATETALTYDLRFTHRVNSGVIWLRTVPISQRRRDTDLRVLMQDYLDDIAGAGYESVDFATLSLVEKRFAAEVLNREEGTIAGKPAFAAEFSVANIDQLHVAQAARSQHVKVVLVRPGFLYKVNAPLWANIKDNNSSSHVYFPVLVIAGFASLPEDYEAGRRDFEGFLKRLVIKGQKGVQLHAVTSATSTAHDAPSATPASQEPVNPTSTSSFAAAPSASSPAAPANDAPAAAQGSTPADASPNTVSSRAPSPAAGAGVAGQTVAPTAATTTAAPPARPRAAAAKH